MPGLIDQSGGYGSEISESIQFHVNDGECSGSRILPAVWQNSDLAELRRTDDWSAVCGSE